MQFSVFVFILRENINRSIRWIRYSHVSMNGASWPACPLHEVQIFVTETDTRETFPGIFSASTKDPLERSWSSRHCVSSRDDIAKKLFLSRITSRDDRRTCRALSDKQSDTRWWPSGCIACSVTPTDASGGRSHQGKSGCGHRVWESIPWFC